MSIPNGNISAGNPTIGPPPQLNLRFLNELGLEKYKGYIGALKNGVVDTPPYDLLNNSKYSERINIDITIENVTFGNHFESSEYLYEKLLPLRENDIDVIWNEGLWNWLSLYYFAQLHPPDKKLLANSKYIASFDSSRDYYRHLMAGPYILYSENITALENIRVALSNRKYIWGEIIEQLSGRQELSGNREILKLFTRLYWDEKLRKPKKSAAGKGPGSVRKLGKFLKQIFLVWDGHEISSDKLFDILPDTF